MPASCLTTLAVRKWLRVGRQKSYSPAKEGEFPREGADSVGWASVSTAPEAALCPFMVSHPGRRTKGGTGQTYPYKAQQVMPGLQGEVRVGAMK